MSIKTERGAVDLMQAWIEEDAAQGGEPADWPPYLALRQPDDPGGEPEKLPDEGRDVGLICIVVTAFALIGIGLIWSLAAISS